VVLAVLADSHGAFRHIGFYVAYNVPYGANYLVANGVASGRTASARLNVAAPAPSASISVSPRVVGRNHDITVSGGHYARYEVVLIRIDGRIAAVSRANSGGAFSVRFRLPDWVRPGRRTIQTLGAKSEHGAKTTFVVTQDQHGQHD
jgi:hypothetical protein